MIGQGLKPRTNNNNQSTMKICKMRDPDLAACERKELL